MMRYSFKDFLTYQNKLNEKCDEEKVEETIDCVLRRLKYIIEKYPTTHKKELNLFFKSMEDDSGDVINLSRYTATELSRIKQYFEEMGFKVSYSYDDAYVSNPCGDIRGFLFEW